MSFSWTWTRTQDDHQYSTRHISTQLPVLAFKASCYTPRNTVPSYPNCSPTRPPYCRYLLLNTAVSSTWGFPSPCPAWCPCDCFDCMKPECACAIPGRMCENLPADFLIDYVRVYQANGYERGGGVF